MEKVKIWGIVVSVGVVITLIGIGTIVSGAGLNQKEHVDHEWTDVDNLHVYYLEMSCKGGNAVNMDYGVSSGTMTVQILSEDGLDELLGTGTVLSSEIFLTRLGASTGTADWTPPHTEKYILVFYNFTQTGATVTVTGTFTGASDTILFLGIAIVVIGIVIAAVGAIKRAKAGRERDATKPQDVAMYPSAPPTGQGPKEPPKT